MNTVPECQDNATEMAALKYLLSLTDRVALLEKFVQSQFGDFYSDFLRQQVERTEKSGSEHSASPNLTPNHDSFTIASTLDRSMSLSSNSCNLSNHIDRKTNSNTMKSAKKLETAVASLKRRDLVLSPNAIELETESDDRLCAENEEPQLEIQSRRRKASPRKTIRDRMLSKKICAKNLEVAVPSSEQLNSCTVLPENHSIIVSKLACSPSHKKSQDGEGKAKCNVCGKYLSNIWSLKDHLNRHRGVKPYKCTYSTYCHKKFSSMSNLGVHVRTHTGEKRFQCNICEKKFSQKTHLEDHVRMHTGEKPFKCTICAKGFSDGSNLRQHLRGHRNENSHECIFCAKTFARRYGLDNHLRLHTGETPFQCRVCSKSFKTVGNVITHTRICHKLT